MKEKDIKTKPQGVLKAKAAPKTNPHMKNAASDIKSAAKDVLARDVVKSKADEIKQNGQSDRAEVQAAESVENAAYTTADTAYHKSKTFVQNKIKRRNLDKKLQEVNAPKVPESADRAMAVHRTNAPKTPERSIDANARNIAKDHDLPQNYAQVKTKKNYIKSQPNAKQSENKTGIKVKSKESYIQSHSSDTLVRDGIKQKSQIPQMPKTKNEEIHTSTPATSKTPKQAQQEYVASKLKTKAEYEKIQTQRAEQPETVQTTLQGNVPKEKAVTPQKESTANFAEKPNKSLVKTKESYMQSLRESKAEAAKSPYAHSLKSKETIQPVRRSAANSKKALKTRDSVVGKSKSIMKSGNAYTGNRAKRQAAKTAKKAVKTQKEVAKKTAKEAAKRAKQAAQKAATKVAIKISVKVAQLIAAAVTKLVSALVAMGGWAVLLVVLIIVIIVAAIAASPFGIFISEEAADSGSIPISSIVAECNMELSNRLDSIESGTAHNRVVLEGEQANWDEVIALFAVKMAGTEDETAQDVVVIDQAKKEILKQVFWDMHSISSRTETVTSGEGGDTTAETVLYITINTKTKDDMIAQYGFTPNQKEALETLLENSDILIASSQSLAISDGTAKGVIEALPDNLSAERKAVIKAACSLVGKVNYFWGGKSSAIGWDNEWGKLKVVSAEGSISTGTKRPFGLDCSGFVTWCFINSGFTESQIGHDTNGQIAKCTRIPWSNAEPGDLAFYSDLSHVGIVAGKDKIGNILIIHCTSNANNVVITGRLNFDYVVKPKCYLIHKKYQQ